MREGHQLKSSLTPPHPTLPSRVDDNLFKHNQIMFSLLLACTPHTIVSSITKLRYACTHTACTHATPSEQQKWQTSSHHSPSVFLVFNATLNADVPLCVITAKQFTSQQHTHSLREAFFPTKKSSPSTLPLSKCYEPIFVSQLDNLIPYWFAQQHSLTDNLFHA